MEKVVLTYEDYAALPDDGLRYELHEGELSVTPAPGARHQLVIGNLHLIVAPHVRAWGAVRSSCHRSTASGPGTVSRGTGSPTPWAA